jgi:hypothetical protein
MSHATVITTENRGPIVDPSPEEQDNRTRLYGVSDPASGDPNDRGPPPNDPSTVAAVIPGPGGPADGAQSPRRDKGGHTYMTGPRPRRRLPSALLSN